MSELINIVGAEAMEALQEEDILVSRPQVEEIAASLLGYPSLAQLMSEHNDASVELGLDDAEVLVLDHPSAKRKAVAVLGGRLPASAVSAVVDACAFAIAECSGITAFDDVDELFDTWASREIQLFMQSAEGVDLTLLKKMKCFEMDSQWVAKESPWESRTEWLIEAKAVMRESEEDCAGQAILDCVGYLKFRKAGRAGLAWGDGGATCALRAPS